MAQNQCVFEYCNFGNGYLKIFIPQNKNSAKEQEIFIDLQDYPIVDGIITQIEPVVDRIKFELKNCGVESLPEVLLLLRCSETYRTVLTLPVKNYIQALYLYNKEMKTKVNKELFQTVNNSYKYGVGYIFNTYYLPKSVIKSFETISKRLNTEIDEVKPFGMSLCDSLEYGGNYVYLENGIKDCSNCLVPHKKGNYDYIMTKLMEYHQQLREEGRL